MALGCGSVAALLPLGCRSVAARLPLCCRSFSKSLQARNCRSCLQCLRFQCGLCRFQREGAWRPQPCPFLADHAPWPSAAAGSRRQRLCHRKSSASHFSLMLGRKKRPFPPGRLSQILSPRHPPARSQLEGLYSRRARVRLQGLRPLRTRRPFCRHFCSATRSDRVAAATVPPLRPAFVVPPSLGTVIGIYPGGDRGR